jgi:hypothetical protein
LSNTYFQNQFNPFKMKLFISISVFLLSLNLCAQKENIATSKWYDGAGGSSFPAASDYTSVKKGLVLYCISNDDKNIYFDLKFTESIEQGKILQMGSTLWVNPDGKSRKLNGIRYPLGAKYSKLRINPGDNQGVSSLIKPSPLALANTIELIGFNAIQEKRFLSNNQDNIRGTIKYDNEGNLLYNLIIPISQLPEGDKNQDKTRLSITYAIEYGAPPFVAGQLMRPSESGAPSGGGGGGGGRSGGRSGGGGSRGGGSGGGGSLGSGPGYQDQPKSEIIWIKKISLAEKK